MNILQSQQSQQFMVFSLFRHIPTTVVVHFIAAAFLIFTVFNIIDAVNKDYIYHWGSLLVCSLLIRSLVLTIFIRSYLAQDVTPTKWESIHARTTVLISVIFSIGYCYLATFGNPIVWASLSFIMVIHISCVIIPSSSSKHALLSAVLPITIPFVGLLLFTSDPTALIFASGITIYTVTILLISYNLHSKLMHGFEVESMYEHEAKVSQVLQEKLQNSTFKDPETHILNRRFFDLMIDEEIRRCKRAGNTLTIALISIDCFSEYLDNHGQQKTIKCVQSLAKILSKATPRGGEYMTRYGTEKFALIVPNVDKDEVLAFGAKIMHLINDADIEHTATTIKKLQRVSVSIGIAEFSPGNIIDVKQLVQQCEDALIEAKKAGGNNMKVSTANLVAGNLDQANSSRVENDEHMLVSAHSDI